MADRFPGEQPCFAPYRRTAKSQHSRTSCKALTFVTHPWLGSWKSNVPNILLRNNPLRNTKDYYVLIPVIQSTPLSAFRKFEFSGGRKNLYILIELLYAYINKKTLTPSHMDNIAYVITHDPKGGLQSGFSLIEILVILAIVAVLAGLSGNALMRWIPEANIKRAARTIVSMCQDARVEAIKRNERMTVNCNNTTNTCVVQFTNGTSHRQFDLSTLRSGVRLTASFNTQFTSRGRATNAGPIPIQNDAARTLTVTVRSSGSIVTN